MEPRRISFLSLSRCHSLFSSQREERKKTLEPKQYGGRNRRMNEFLSITLLIQLTNTYITRCRHHPLSSSSFNDRISEEEEEVSFFRRYTLDQIN